MSFVDENGNAERMQSKECYQTWVHTRKSPPKKPQESFRRVLTAHACGVDGRRPFPEDVEASLLKVLRRKEVWDCFKGTGVSIGIRGFRNVGYHEKLRTEEQALKRGSAKEKAGEKLASKQSARSRKRGIMKDRGAVKKTKLDHSNQTQINMAMQNAYMQQQALQQLNQFGAAMPFMMAPHPGIAYTYSPDMQYNINATKGATQPGMTNVQAIQQHQIQMQEQMQRLLQHHAQSQAGQQSQLATMQASSGHPGVSFYNGAVGQQMGMTGPGYIVPVHPGAQQVVSSQSQQTPPKKYR